MDKKEEGVEGLFQDHGVTTVQNSSPMRLLPTRGPISLNWLLPLRQAEAERRHGTGKKQEPEGPALLLLEMRQNAEADEQTAITPRQSLQAATTRLPVFRSRLAFSHRAEGRFFCFVISQMNAP